MERGRRAGDVENAADLPSGFAAARPVQAFEFSRGKRDVGDLTVAGSQQADMSMKQHGHELEHRTIFPNAGLEGRSALVGSEADDHAGACPGWYRDGKPVTDAVAGRLLKNLAAFQRYDGGQRVCSPVEGSDVVLRSHNDRIVPLEALLEVSRRPCLGIGGDQRWVVRVEILIYAKQCSPNACEARDMASRSAVWLRPSRVSSMNCAKTRAWPRRVASDRNMRRDRFARPENTQ
jgi:hypothetical protein